jgi:hypothetical protein
VAAMQFCEGLLRSAGQISLANGAGRLQLSIGVHTGATQVGGGGGGGPPKPHP